MAKPDCDDGWMMLAHELFAAVMVAGFNKWECVVLREVFAQIYGPVKSRTAVLSPTDIAGRAGTFKESVVRAIRSLKDCGVLVESGDGYRFVKDYEQWTWKGSPRISDRESEYCKRAKPKNASKNVGNEGAHASTKQGNESVTASTSMGNEFVPDRGTDLFPTGNGFVPPESVPPRPPIEEPRAELKKEEEEKKEGGNPPSPLKGFDPEQQKLIDRAGERWGSVGAERVVGDWLLDYPTDWVREACDRLWAKFEGRLGADGVAYGKAILQGYAASGGPKKPTPRKGGEVPLVPKIMPASVAMVQTPEQIARQQADIARFKAEGGYRGVAAKVAKGAAS